MYAEGCHLFGELPDEHMGHAAPQDRIARRRATIDGGVQRRVIRPGIEAAIVTYFFKARQKVGLSILAGELQGVSHIFCARV